MRPLIVVLCAILSGCTTLRNLEDNPHKAAETVCHFAFLATLKAIGSITGAAVCSFGVEELPDDDDQKKKRKPARGPAKVEPKTAAPESGQAAGKAPGGDDEEGDD